MNTKHFFFLAFILIILQINVFSISINPLDQLKVTELSKLQSNQEQKTKKTYLPSKEKEPLNKKETLKLSKIEKIFFELALSKSPELELPKTLVVEKLATQNIQTNSNKENEQLSTPNLTATPYLTTFIEDLLTKKERNSLLKQEKQNRVSLTKSKIKEQLYISNKDKIVRQFGYATFKKEQNQVNPNLIPVNPEYVLGSGDQLLIRLWGKIEEVINVTLDKNGNIYLPRVGHINLNQVKFKHIERIITRALEKHYVNFEVSISMTKLKTITVYIIGNVNSPGSYDISSLSTIINALYQAGGPTKEGSLRHVKLNRKNKKSISIDLYDYLIKGHQNTSTALKDQDTLFIPPIGNVIKIDGFVKRPGIYELKDNESLYTVMNSFAGGFSINALKELIKVKRQTNHGHSQFDIENNENNFKKFQMKNGDIIHISKLNSRHSDIVTIKGNILNEGHYQYSENMTLSKLIKKANGLKENTARHYIELYRFKSDKKREIKIINLDKTPYFKLRPLDVIQINSTDLLTEKDTVFIEGAVSKPGHYYLLNNMTLFDLVILAKLEAHAKKNQIELFRNDNGVEALYKVNLNDLYKNPKQKANFTLKKNDHVYIRSKNNANRFKKIVISGEVKYPGTYLARDNESLESIIKRAGGVTNTAFLKGAKFYRKSTQKVESEGKRKVLEEEKKRLIFDEKRIQAMSSQNQSIVYERAIKFLEKKITESKGRITINLENILNNKSTLIIEDEDTLDIPETPATIQVIGGVEQPTAILFSPSKKTKHYINECGGLTEFANKRKVYIFKANGSIKKNRSKVELGDTIYVPEKIKPNINWLRTITEVSQTIFNVVTSLKVTGIIP